MARNFKLKKNRRQRGQVAQALVVLLVMLTVLSVGFFVGGFCWEYTFEHWIQYLKGVYVDVPFWACGILGVVSFPLAIVLFLFTIIFGVALGF